MSEGIQVVWDDNHQSIYDLKWLKLRSFLPEEQQKWLDYNHASYKTWSSESFNSIEKFNFLDVMSSDKSLLQWLQVLDVYGVCLLEDVPHNLGQVAALANQVAFIRKTHYGYEAYFKLLSD